MKRFGATNEPYCFFCGSTAGKDRKLITGPSGNSFICDKCVAICQGILAQEEANILPIALKDALIRVKKRERLTKRYTPEELVVDRKLFLQQNLSYYKNIVDVFKEAR